MNLKYSIALVALVLSACVFGQDSLWKPIKVDENLTVSIPQKIVQIDTTFRDKGPSVDFRMFKAEALASTLAVNVTPKGTNINVDDEQSLKSALNEIAKGTCEGFINRGFDCKSKDSSMFGMPCKKFEIFSAGISVPVLYTYYFLVNDRLYMFVITPSILNGDKVKLAEESNRFLNSIHFTKTVKEKKFATKAESTAYKFGYYLIPLLLIIGIIAYIVMKVTRS